MSEKLIEYRRVRAKETLEDAKRLFDAGSLFSAVNRSNVRFQTEE